jgi:hypothetical protein
MLRGSVSIASDILRSFANVDASGEKTILSIEPIMLMGITSSRSMD